MSTEREQQRRDFVERSGWRGAEIVARPGDASTRSYARVSLNDRKAMLIYSRNVFFLSIAISLFTAMLIFLAINRLMIVPIRKMTGNMQEFSAEPSDPGRVLEPAPGRDELSIAGQHLAAMQQQLQKTLKQQKNLADLHIVHARPPSEQFRHMRNSLACGTA